MFKVEYITPDTNILLNDDLDFKLEDYKKVYIPIVILEELDKLKEYKNSGKSCLAQKAIKKLKEASNVEFVTSIKKAKAIAVEYSCTDNLILIYAKYLFDTYGAIFATSDYNMVCKAKAFNIECKFYETVPKVEEKEPYLGYKVLQSAEDLAMFYQSEKRNINCFNLKVNEYIVTQDTLGTRDKYKWNGKEYKKILWTEFKNSYFEKIKPKDVYQELLMDSLFADDFTIITGKAGSGKSLFALNYCMTQIQDGLYDNIVILFNPTKTFGSTDMGFYGGDLNKKTTSSFIGNMLGSKFGSMDKIEAMIGRETLKIIPMADMRGMEVTKRQILYITEAQNTTPELMRVALSRVSEKAKCIIEGDNIHQKDIRGNGVDGLTRAIDVFKDQDFVSYVHLQKCYRSRIADLADLL